jgi:WD40 repeat protein
MFGANIFRFALGALRPVRVTSIDDAGNEGCPVLAPDELTIYFCSDRVGGFGDHDFYLSRRSSASEPFGAEFLVTDVDGLMNTSIPEGPTWVSPDNCELFFLRDTLYVATRSP